MSLADRYDVFYLKMKMEEVRRTSNIMIASEKDGTKCEDRPTYDKLVKAHEKALNEYRAFLDSRGFTFRQIPELLERRKLREIEYRKDQREKYEKTRKAKEKAAREKEKALKKKAKAQAKKAA